MGEHAELIEKVEGKLEALLRIYAQVYATLSRVNRQEYAADRLQQLDEALEPPSSINTGKAVAILKAIMGSTTEDRFQLESFYGVPTSGGSSVGSYIGEELKALGLGYHDLLPFLTARGWLKTV